MHHRKKQSLIEILNPNKTSGPDGISNKMLTPVAKEVSVPLSIFFNRSFREGSMPTSLFLHQNKVTILNHPPLDQFLFYAGQKNYMNALC